MYQDMPSSSTCTLLSHRILQEMQHQQKQHHHAKVGVPKYFHAPAAAAPTVPAILVTAPARFAPAAAAAAVTAAVTAAVAAAAATATATVATFRLVHIHQG